MSANINQMGGSAQVLKGLHNPLSQAVLCAHSFAANAAASVATLGDELIDPATLLDPFLFNQVSEYGPRYIARMVCYREVETGCDPQIDIAQALGMTAQLANHHLHRRVDEFVSFGFLDIHLVWWLSCNRLE
jgi:hypothetical protein